ncbi:MAG: family 43 glycosylhydrolase [Colwellia sp.]
MNKNKSAKFLAITFCISLSILLSACGQQQTVNKTEYVAYLFAYFTGNDVGEEQVHYALSRDGFNYRALNNNKPIINSDTISRSGGVRDPHILRGENGWFYMVLTDLYVPKMGWQNTAMIMLKSKNLIDWSHAVVDIPQTFAERFSEVNRVWAPQTIYDAKAGKYMVYFSMRENQAADIIYYAYANDDFTGLSSEPKQLYFPPKESNNRASIDGDIIEKEGKFYLFHKAEDGEPGIKLAISDQLTQGYKLVSNDRIDSETSPVEGSGTFKLIGSDDYILMYDIYTKGKYQFTKSSDLTHFDVVDQQISMNFHPRHGTVIAITQDEVNALVAKWGTFEGAIVSTNTQGVKKINQVIDDEKQTIYLPLKSAVDLNQFDPQFITTLGVTISPQGAQNFSQGAVDYKVSLAGKTKTYQVSAAINNNPVLDGYYADPEIIFSVRDNKYYMYPTSDGFTGWSGTYFETFSSTDLINWKNEGVILDLHKDVSWADRNAWAPTAIEKKINGEYQYFYYFTAAQKIGVAVSDNPQGPFVDSGKPLIDFKPEGVNGGQEIDPDVFTDPVSGKSYLYWGNGYLAAVELNEDMVSFDKTAIKLLTPDASFREGAEIFYRDGKYYFLWSENDTRDPDYRVRYATADSPLGPLTIPKDNVVITKDIQQEIYATGHNSVINKSGTDEWFIVYHRFTRPHGINMGRAAGYNREVCIDKLAFNRDGSLIETTPTLKGLDGF